MRKHGTLSSPDFARLACRAIWTVLQLETYPHAVLSIGVGAVVPAPTLQQSVSTTRQVTRTPKAPFFTLIGLGFLYALIGIILSTVAFASKPRATKPIRARLGGHGLIAALFEGDGAEQKVTNLTHSFEEGEADQGQGEKSDRRAMLPTLQGGWIFEMVKVP